MAVSCVKGLVLHRIGLHIRVWIGPWPVATAMPGLVPAVVNHHGLGLHVNWPGLHVYRRRLDIGRAGLCVDNLRLCVNDLRLRIDDLRLRVNRLGAEYAQLHTRRRQPNRPAHITGMGGGAGSQRQQGQRSSTRQCHKRTFGGTIGGTPGRTFCKTFWFHHLLLVEGSKCALHHSTRGVRVRLPLPGEDSCQT